MILKASAAKGSPSSGLRTTTSSVPGFKPSVAGTSSGLGRKSTTASSRGCTPLFLKADPHSTGTTLPVTVPWRSRRTRVASSGSSPLR